MADRFDHGRLRSKMREQRITQEVLAKNIGIAASTMNLKLSGKRDFTEGEILGIAKVLHLEAVDPYFFAERLS